jgi:mono/diheme cytochrome c family protein
MRKYSIALLAALGVASFSVQADTASAHKLADKYAAIAKHIDPASKGQDAEAGKAFFNRELTIKGKQVACASCHTTNPAATGKHMVTGKPIKPLAPSANGDRFSNLDKVEKNFEKHCLDIIGRDCTAQEKANYIAYLLTVK